MYLAPTQAKQDEIKLKLATPPIQSLPNISEAAAAASKTRKLITFDALLQNEQPATRYQPLYLPSNLVDESQAAEKLCLLSLVTDFLFAFQTNHKMAAQSLMKLYLSDSLNPMFRQSVIDGLLTYLLNSGCPSNGSSSGNQNTPKPPCFFGQVANIIIQDLLDEGKEFHQQLTDSALKMLANLEFTSGYFQYVSVNTIQFLVLLDSQLGNGT